MKSQATDPRACAAVRPACRREQSRTPASGDRPFPRTRRRILAPAGGTGHVVQTREGIALVPQPRYLRLSIGYDY